jgi:serine/threonine kinase 16
MRCPSGTPTLRLALSEIETTRRFRSPHTIRLLDSCVEQTADGHTVYLFLPLCRGTLQDALAARAVRGETADEASSLRLFRGAAEGLKSMHTWRLPDVGAQPGAAPADVEAAAAEDEEHGEEDERRLLPGQDDSGEAAYPPKPPRMEGSAVPSSDGPVGKGGDLCAWAHRDIKPA